MKRFYKQAAVIRIDRGFLVELDGRVVKTPEKRPNISPTRPLATAICREWNNQGDKVNPDSMPMAKLQNTALDRVEIRRSDLIGELVKYADTDLLCYRADYPLDLARQQETLWQPLLDWVSDRHGVDLKVTTGILHLAQEAAQLARLEQYLQGVDSFRLAAFYNITTLCGSVSVALNVMGGNILADQAWAAAQLDENYQIDAWGIDDEAKIRQDNMKAELDAATRFLDLL
ncbi:Chaperone required for the assembly of the mitochondrial F1-ATPase [hydrothermal vent metagenome]|uniref:Chaperone required for the assembly of the mitochondrial F1-ATPase n=1 Tax=hydrothermal vent metagenome TaxID=652676 RepID=A0A3B0STE9_9ZZZZ